MKKFLLAILVVAIGMGFNNTKGVALQYKFKQASIMKPT